MVKQTMEQPFHGVLRRNEKKQTIDTHNKLDESWILMLSEKNDPKFYIPKWFHLDDILEMME